MRFVYFGSVFFLRPFRWGFLGGCVCDAGDGCEPAVSRGAAAHLAPCAPSTRLPAGASGFSTNAIFWTFPVAGCVARNACFLVQIRDAAEKENHDQLPTAACHRAFQFKPLKITGRGRLIKTAGPAAEGVGLSAAVNTLCMKVHNCRGSARYFLWKLLSKWWLIEIFIGSKYSNEHIRLVNLVLQKICTDLQH